MMENGSSYATTRPRHRLRSRQRSLAMIRVLLADDHALLRDGLRRILQSTSEAEVVGEAADAATTLQLARKADSQILVLDLSMPGRNGLELLKQIREEKPALRILVLTMHAEEEYA